MELLNNLPRHVCTREMAHIFLFTFFLQNLLHDLRACPRSPKGLTIYSTELLKNDGLQENRAFVLSGPA